MREDYHRLIEELRRQDLWPDRLVHCWNVRPRDGSLSIETFRRAQDMGFYSLLFLSQALGSRTSANPTFMCILTAGLHDVIGEETLRPELAPLMGVSRVIPQEYVNLSCRVVDLHVSTAGDEALTRPVIARLLAEHSVGQDEPVVAYRGAHRWVPTYQPVKLDQSDELPALLRTRGVYVITGGLGGVGLELADYLVRTVKARLVLIGRSKPSAEQAERLKALEQAGGEIFTVQADVADEQHVRFALAQALDRFGGVHGVIHAAGVPGGGLIDLKTVAALESEFAPKVNGAFVIDHVFRKVPVDFICFCSSLNALTGGVGQVGYCAANATLDALAHKLSKRGARVISVNFDRWNHVGMAVQADARLKALQIETSEFDGMAASEAQEAFGRILHGWMSPQVIVSVRDCSALMRQSAGTSLSQVIGVTAEEEGLNKKLLRGDTDQIVGATIEDTVTHVWQQILGVDHVGLHDDFFVLGGESLAALQILNRVQGMFGMEVSLKKFFENPTVAGLSDQIRHEQEGGITAAPDIVPLPRKAHAQRMSPLQPSRPGRQES